MDLGSGDSVGRLAQVSPRLEGMDGAEWAALVPVASVATLDHGHQHDGRDHEEPEETHPRGDGDRTVQKQGKG